MLPYDETDPEDIENYAKRLIGKTFYDILKNYFKDNNLELEKTFNKNKGKLGNLIEKYYFYYEPNSNPHADFEKANTELKVTPYIKGKNGTLRAKERLVIGMIPNDKPIETNFEKSHVLEKLQLILLILYFHDKNKNKLDYSIDFVKLFSILGENCKKDLEIIKKDYKIIVDKIISGNAHKLSEGDTNYLGACTKGSTAEKSLQKQYYGDMPAKRRAFSLKQSYMSYVLNTYIVGNVPTYDSIVKEDENVYFEDIVLKKIRENIGLTISTLFEKYNIQKCNNKNKSKQVNNILVCRMLDVKGENVEEFEKANIEIKTIRIEKNNQIKESISGPSIKIKDLAQKEFENSQVYNYFSETKFLFVMFKKNKIDEYELIGAKFWNMPIDELESIGKDEWILYQNKFKEGVNFKLENGKVKNDLPKKRETKIFHLRPRARKSGYDLKKNLKYSKGNAKDMDELPNGDKMTKQCFWLNNDYIIKIIKDIIIKGEEK
jgi:putative type II restriction endonuclease